MPDKFDLCIIGAGPGGYVAAIRAAQLGLKVACVDANKQLGGTCLRVGCIPSKALLESSERFQMATDSLAEHGVLVGEVGLDLAVMQKRKDKLVTILTKGIESLFKKHGITRFVGHGKLTAPGKVTVEGDETVELEAEHIILATGSVSASLKGVEVDGERIGTSTEALAYDEVPERLVVIGAGAIGLELGSVWSRLGSEVTVVEYLDRILPGMDDDLATEALKIFKKQGLAFHLGAKVTGAKVEGDEAIVEVEGLEPLTADKVLVAVGRRPNTTNLGLEDVGVDLDDRGRVKVDDDYVTNIKGIYAIGDLIAGPMLAHKAEEEGVACVEKLVTGYGHVNYDAVPAICYTHPEIAGVGQTEAQLKLAGTAYRKGVFPFMASGRAKALSQTDGRVKVLADAETDRILGVHIIGPHAGDQIAEATVAMEFGASSEDLARAFHAHPTLAEALKEAALAVDGRAIHM